ncbi:unnamed protein product [Haemonchus placei]|uniref:Uncharacterized protein n=1 Tax=Haemonchus placei TaxID=6290 RepID=A0A0N4WPN9_HAEPC|nr:unnamed protein product [Haemonchus placei]
MYEFRASRSSLDMNARRTQFSSSVHCSLVAL